MDSGIDCFATSDTWSNKLTEGAFHNRARVVFESCAAGIFTVHTFETVHDCPGSCGFVIQAGGESLLFATDTMMITQRFTTAFDIIALECNYDQEDVYARVAAGEMNKRQAMRVFASHMGLDATADYLTRCCDLSKCKELHLIHLSQTNIDADKARRVIKEATMIDGIICGDIEVLKEAAK